MKKELKREVTIEPGQVDQQIKNCIERIANRIEECEYEWKALRFAHRDHPGTESSKKEISTSRKRTVSHSQQIQMKNGTEIILSPLRITDNSPREKSNTNKKIVLIEEPGKEDSIPPFKLGPTLSENSPSQGLGDHVSPQYSDVPNTKIQIQEQERLSQDEAEEQEDDHSKYLEKYRIFNQNTRPIGMLLYEKYICFVMLLFTLLSLLSAPAMYYNFLGDGLSSIEDHTQLNKFTEFVLKLSNANQNFYDVSKLTDDDLREITQNKLFIFSTDIACTALIFVFILFWRSYSQNQVELNLEECPKPFMFAIEVSWKRLDISPVQAELPLTKVSSKSVHLTIEDIHRHFSSFGKVAQVSPVRKYCNLLHIIMSFVKIVKKQAKIRLKTYDEAGKVGIYLDLQRKYLSVMDAYLALRAKKDEDIESDNFQIYLHEHGLIFLEPSSDEVPIQSAFVVFEQLSDCRRVAELQEYGVWGSRFRHMKGNNQFELRAQACRANPLNINWENYHFQKEVNRKRFFCQCFIVSTVILIITLGLFLININRISLASSKTHSHTQLSLVSAYEMQLYWRQKATQISANPDGFALDQLKKFCQQLEDSRLSSEYGETCLQFQNTIVHSLSLLWLAALSLFIFFINLLTSKILRAMVLFRRYKTVADRDSFLIISMALFSLLNSGFLVVAVRHPYMGPWLASFVGAIFGLEKYSTMTLVEIFPQFNRRWHIVVGGQLISNFMMALILMPFSYLLTYWIRKTYRDRRQNRKSIPAEKKEFDYCMFYAMSLKAYLFCLAYSNTMPIFYLLGLLSFLAQYLIRRIAMQFFLVDPLFLDWRANELLVKILPYGLVVHVITSYLFFEAQEIMPSLSEFSKVSQIDEQFFAIIEKRLAYLLLILLVLFIIFYRKRIMVLFSRFIKRDKDDHFLTQSVIELPEKQAESRRKDSSQFPLEESLSHPNLSPTSSAKISFTEMLKNPSYLSSFCMQDNPRYKTAKYALDIIESHATEIIRTQTRLRAPAQ